MLALMLPCACAGVASADGAPAHAASQPAGTTAASSIGNQQLMLTVARQSSINAAGWACLARGTSVRARMTRHVLAHGADLRLRSVTFTLGKQVKQTRRLPAGVSLSLRGLKPGLHLLTVRAFYDEQVTARGQRHKRTLTLTISKSLKTHVRVC